MRAVQLLEQAATAVARRRATYGQPTDVFDHVARRCRSLVLEVKSRPLKRSCA